MYYILFCWTNPNYPNIDSQGVQLAILQLQFGALGQCSSSFPLFCIFCHTTVLVRNALVRASKTNKYAIPGHILFDRIISFWVIVHWQPPFAKMLSTMIQICRCHSANPISLWAGMILGVVSSKDSYSLMSKSEWVLRLFLLADKENTKRLIISWYDILDSFINFGNWSFVFRELRACPSMCSSYLLLGQCKTIPAFNALESAGCGCSQPNLCFGFAVCSLGWSWTALRLRLGLKVLSEMSCLRIQSVRSIRDGCFDEFEATSVLPL